MKRVELDYTRVDRLIDYSLREDLGDGDITTNALTTENEDGKAVIRAKARGVIAGLPIAKRVFQKLDHTVVCVNNANDGEEVKSGYILCELNGSKRALLSGERLALNIVQRLSGIATLTSKYVKAVEGLPVKILDTRKTVPGMRVLDKYAVSVGGGFNHRFGLYDGILIKDNHIKVAGGISDAVHIMKKKYKNRFKIEKDLNEYRAAVREPVRGTYRGYEIYSMPPPSSGGVHLIEILNVLEGFPLGEYGHNTAKTINLMAEAMKFAYADRSEHLGDPDFKKVPVEVLTSKKYAENLRKRISPGRVTPSVLIKPGEMPPGEGQNTTHFSVIDSGGNMVSNTYTLNFDYGSKITVPGTGILLNNEMDDFSMKPGEPNAYGLLGGQANAPEPEKRMLSSMTPTIVLKDGAPFLATGSPGGSLIITTVLQIITNVIDFGMNISEATNAPRVHHQWLPDKLRVEKGISEDTLRLLKERGYSIDTGNTMGSAQSIMKKGEFLYGASDPRRPGGLAEGY